ncbi:sensor histidine kinase [Hyalangium gracile]|uniref:sensor histidine kinase n=1 Tax=Hyalangium gracile TaxID=394092 RepID=UPI00295E6462|nr:triple tyrosine motif-containing protein [Hyalangium gracile]
MRVWHQALLLGLVAVLSSFAATAQPSSQDRRLTQFHHTRWTIKEGAPGQVSALAQTEDGFLWLSAAASLYRFDGVRFERFEPPSGEPLPSIRTLHAARGGGLWMGFSFGGVAFLEQGRVTRYGGAEGAPDRTVSAFATDKEGQLWVAAVDGLFRLAGTRWEKVGASWGYPGAPSRFVFVDRDGVLWVATDKTLLYLPRGARTFVPTGISVNWTLQLTQAPDGRIWMSESGGVVRPIPVPGHGQTDASPSLRLESAGMLFARDGSFWVTSLGDGIRRIAHPERLPAGDATAVDGAVESFTEKDGLSGDYAWPVLEDREGNFWVGTSGGLDRFRVSPMVLAEFPRGSHDFALVAGKGGEVWAGTTNRQLMRLRDGKVSFEQLASPVRSAYRDQEGVVWLGADNGLWRLDDGRLGHVTPLLQDSVTQVQAMTRDRRGTLWVVPAANTVMQWKDGRWVSMKEVLGLSDDERIHTAMTDGRGRVWLGHVKGIITRVDGDEVRRFTEAEGLRLGRISALAAGGRYVWAGGQFGLAFLDGERFRPLVAGGDESFRNVTGIIERPDGSLWVHAVPGVFRIPAEEIRHAAGDPGHRVRYELFDFLDGLPARPTLMRPLPTAVAGDDGRLWFATSNGVVWIDPERIARNPLPPPVSILSLKADGQRFAPASDVTLPLHPANLEINYTALSLSIPERVRFRYRLEGVDEHWQDVGTRRTAYYGDLSPGRYRFQVVASNNDGVWNERGASLEFVVPPAVHQTWWFRALCVAAGLLLLWLLYLLRLRQVTAKMRGLLEERHAERERIARELHDTLLQSVQGLVLRLQAVAEQIPEQEPARQAMEKALDRADEVLAEGRDRVMELRSSAHDGRGLPDVLVQVGEELAEDMPMSFRLLVEGGPRELEAAVQGEIFLIAREALLNAFQHAGGTAVEVELHYDSDELRVRIRDDGAGVAPEILEKGGRPGHWGLAGMHERATRIGATLRVWSRTDAGTEVELKVPAAIVYRRRPRATRWSRLKAAVRLGRGR